MPTSQMVHLPPIMVCMLLTRQAAQLTTALQSLAPTLRPSGFLLVQITPTPPTVSPSVLQETRYFIVEWITGYEQTISFNCPTPRRLVLPLLQAVPKVVSGLEVIPISTALPLII